MITRPEADPAVLLTWVENESDLQTIHNAAKVTLVASLQSYLRWYQATNDYSITVSQEFANEFWKKELTQVVYELYPGIMETLKTISFKVSIMIMIMIWLSSLVFLPCTCHHDWYETHCWSQDWCHPGSWVIILTIIITTDHSCSVISSLKVWRWCSSWTLSPMCFISSRSICTVTTCRSRRTGNLANTTSPVSTLVVSLIPLHFK